MRERFCNLSDRDIREFVRTGVRCSMTAPSFFVLCTSTTPCSGSVARFIRVCS